MVARPEHQAQPEHAGVEVDGPLHVGDVDRGIPALDHGGSVLLSTHADKGRRRAYARRVGCAPRRAQRPGPVRARRYTVLAGLKFAVVVDGGLHAAAIAALDRVPLVSALAVPHPERVRRRGTGDYDAFLSNLRGTRRTTKRHRSLGRGRRATARRRGRGLRTRRRDGEPRAVTTPDGNLAARLRARHRRGRRHRAGRGAGRPRRAQPRRLRHAGPVSRSRRMAPRSPSPTPTGRAVRVGRAGRLRPRARPARAGGVCDGRAGPDALRVAPVRQRRRPR